MPHLFYHGTVKAYLGEILQEGLKSVHEHRWFAKWWDTKLNISRDIDNGVYLTEEKPVAEAFAQAKANYLAAKPGEFFDFGWRDLAYKMQKNKRAPVIHTTPVVLRVIVPDEYWEGLLVDPHGGDHPGAICKCTIEPKFISVEEQW